MDHLRSDSMLHDVVAGRFRLVEHLGEGTVGDIYLAEHRVLVGRKYALKVLKRRFLSNRTVAERFRREALVASRLDHPNIVEISDFGRAANGRLFLAMEHIEGETLGEAIAEHLPGVMPLRRALRILVQVARGVGAAHDAGVLHRDLKPDNIMLTVARGAELVKILDFGLAKVMVNAESLVLTKRGEMFGTPMYMSPEQARGEDVDSRTDIYAFGAIAYEVCTGRPPLSASALDRLLVAIQTQVPEPPSRVHPMGPAAMAPELDEVILRCLAKDREDRPLRISDVGSAIEDCLARHESLASSFLETVEHVRLDMEELTGAPEGSGERDAPSPPAQGSAAGSAVENASPSESIVDVSIVEIDPWHWREVSASMVQLAGRLKELGLCPLEVVSILVSLGDLAARTRGLAMELDAAGRRLDAVEAGFREQAAQLRHAVIDLSLERGQVAEEPGADPRVMADLDYQIKELEQRLAQVYRRERASRADPEREVRELEQRLEQATGAQTELEFQLLSCLRSCRPASPPAEIVAAYEELEALLRER